MSKKFIIPPEIEKLAVKPSVQHRIFAAPPFNPLAPKGSENWVIFMMEKKALVNQKKFEKERKIFKLSDFI